MFWGQRLGFDFFEFRDRGKGCVAAKVAGSFFLMSPDLAREMEGATYAAFLRPGNGCRHREVCAAGMTQLQALRGVCMAR